MVPGVIEVGTRVDELSAFSGFSKFNGKHSTRGNAQNQSSMAKYSLKKLRVPTYQNFGDQDTILRRINEFNNTSTSRV